MEGSETTTGHWYGTVGLDGGLGWSVCIYGTESGHMAPGACREPPKESQASESQAKMSNPSKAIETSKNDTSHGGAVDPVGVQKVEGVAFVRGNSYENPLEFLKAVESHRRQVTKELSKDKTTEQNK
ncbi:hypothetical protein GNI_011040 [Gregarina niphandrodes]|uniref:Uncharacterized protein n=1 Tax=Gregarina niphandrodes TaxID=110365 RepID=A0A023BCU7_GRENI|nr:hypothetical protein GNI_011040 [Gregarina niphandrodes]EZG86037.1 hypothetical protein GNI_011040 [Gregarina niphandrodes]|eukprot:XP_011128792.1 hypothetical protein GNI_011040 [Gregarina niphandrodes]